MKNKVPDSFTNTLSLHELILQHGISHDDSLLDIAKKMIENGTDINISDEYGVTPLHVATQTENMIAYRFLIQNGADVHARTKSGETISDFCWTRTIHQMANRWQKPRIVTSHKNNQFMSQTILTK